MKIDLKADIIHDITFGQSLSLGSGTIVNTSPIDNLLMFEGGVTSAYAADYWAKWNSLVPLVEGVQPSNQSESLGFSYGSSILHFLQKENGFTPDTNNIYSILLTCSGNGGKSIAELSTGTDYARLTDDISHAVTRANALGKTLKVLGIAFIHSERDYEINTTQAAYRASLQALQAQVEAFVQTTTGQTEKVPFILAQTASHNIYSDSPIHALTQLDLAVNSEGFELGTSLYHFDYQSDGSNVHLTGTAYRQMAAELGYYRKRLTVDNEPKRFIYPKRYHKQGKIIEITFNVPGSTLVFDTDTVVDPGNYGFNVYNGSSQAVTITEVKIVRPNTVRITTDTAIASGFKVTYAINGTALKAGKTYGSRGCLRDNQGVKTTYINNTPVQGNSLSYNIHNWCPIFQYIF